MGDFAVQKGEQLVEIVDERNNVIEIAERRIADGRKLRMRAARVIVLDPERRILFQVRSPEKSVYPGLHDTGVGEVACVSEPYEATAVRGIIEEILPDGQANMLNGSITFLCELPPYEDEKIKRNYRLFLFNYDASVHGTITPEKSEVTEVRWAPVPELKELLKSRKFTPVGEILGRAAISIAEFGIGKLQKGDILKSK